MLRRTTSSLLWLTEPHSVDTVLADQLVACWRDVTNAGGAVGFPFPPVSDVEVRSAVDQMVASLSQGGDRLLVALADDELAGWLLLIGNSSRLTAHWASVARVQTTPAHRGTGVGRALMEEVARAARIEYGLEQLHINLRSGMDLESFYARLGWRIVGRWPSALRFDEDDLRDEILMCLTLSSAGPPPR